MGILRIIRNTASRLIYSNRVTRALFRRLALDERCLTDLLSTSGIRHRIKTDSEVRKRFQILIEKTRVSRNASFMEEVFCEPGLELLQRLLDDNRMIGAICSDRALLRRILRNNDEQRMLADEVAQYGSLLHEVILTPRAKKALEKHFAALRGKRDAAEEANTLLDVLVQSGAYEAALASNSQLASTVRKMARNEAAIKESTVQKVKADLRNMIEEMANASPEEQQSLADLLHREWVFRVLSNNEDWRMRFIQRPSVLEKAVKWEAYVVALLSHDDVFERIAGNRFLIERLLSNESVRDMILSSPALLNTLASDPRLAGILKRVPPQKGPETVPIPGASE